MVISPLRHRILPLAFDPPFPNDSPFSSFQEFARIRQIALGGPSKFHVSGCGFSDLGGVAREKERGERLLAQGSAQITPLGDVSPRKRPFCSHIFYLIAARLSCIALIREPHRSSGERGSWSGTTPATGQPVILRASLFPPSLPLLSSTSNSAAHICHCPSHCLRAFPQRVSRTCAAP